MAVHLADEMAKVKRIVVGQCRGPAEDKFCFLPRRCFLTGKSLFMKKAVRATRYLESYRSPMNNQIKQHFWVDRDQYLLNQLKGK
jgi:hypothetical protein